MAGPLLAAGIAAGAQLISTGATAYAQGKMNKKTRKWNEKMYGIQRQDALSDWNMQNEYNSPAQQMARLKAAGLNPNLVYENGATQSASSVNSTHMDGWNPQTADFSGISNAAQAGIQAYQDATLQSEQIKNMQAQRTNMQLDSTLKGIQVSSDMIKNSKDSLELALSQRLFDTTVSTAEQQLRAISVGTDIRISQEARDAAMHAPNLESAIQDVYAKKVGINLAKQQIDNLRRTGVLQDMEINLRKLGLSFHDSAILRVLSQFADGKSLPDVVRSLWDTIQAFGSHVGDGVAGGVNPFYNNPSNDSLKARIERDFGKYRKKYSF